MNIEEEIPALETKRVVKIAYAGWMISVATLIINVAALCARMSVVGDGQSIGDFVVSLIYFVFLTPVWFLVFRILYRAARLFK